MRDGLGYSINGWWIAQRWLVGIFPSSGEVVTTTGTIGPYDFWNAAVYYITGRSPLSILFINCLAGALTIIFVYLITSQLFNKKAARIASFLTAIWPSTFLWSTQNLKEPIVTLCVIVIIWAFVSMRNNRLGFLGLLLTFGAFIPLYNFRNIWAYMLVVAVALSLLLPNLKPIRWLIVILLISLAGSAVINAIESFGIVRLVRMYLLKDITLLTSDISIFEEIEYLRNVRTMASRSAFMRGAELSSLKGCLTFLPIGLFYTFFAPFPWQMGTTMQLFAFPESIAWYCMVPFLVRGMRLSFVKQWRQISVMIFFAGIVSVLLALIEGNVGTIFRHRCVLWPIIFIFASLGITKWRQDSKKRVNI